MNYNFYDKLILRTPLKALKTKFSVNDLKEIFTSIEGGEALFLASPDLYREFLKWNNGEIKDKTKEEKLISSLYKYASRMHSRCTPFGLFAKCTIVDWGENTNIQLGDADFFRSTRLDMHFSCQLAQKLAELDYIKPLLKFYPNTSLYIVNEKMRYVEYNYVNKARDYQISAVDFSVYINHLIETAKKGAKVDELADALVSFDEELEFEESKEFVLELIKEQILVSEIEPSVSGEELMEQILAVLNRVSATVPSSELGKMITFINEIQADIKAIDNEVFNDTSSYSKLEEKLKTLDIPYELSKLFQTDLFSKNSSSHTIKKTIRPKIRKALELINKLSPKIDMKTNLSVFKESFYKRYEENEVPLLTVLDNEAGIGYASNTNHTGGHSPLVNDLAVGERQRDSIQEIKWGPIQSLLLRKLYNAREKGAFKIEITDADLKDFKSVWNDLPDSMSTMVSLAGDNIILGGVGGTSSVNLLGRFASGHKGIEAIIKEVGKVESNLKKEQILAEIVHLPEARTGNILMRPSFREYEIPYLSKSDLPEKQQIQLEDLFISVKNDRLFLRSKRLNKEVIPRMANAHNYSFNSLPVYHFLCDLQSREERAGVYFSWGPLESNFSFLPRVEIAEVIVSPATWNLNKEHFTTLLESNGEIDKIANWRNDWKLPDLIVLADSDNELLINLTDSLSVKALISTIKKRPNIVLKEFPFDENQKEITDSEGTIFTNQLITLFTKRTETEDKVEGKEKLQIESKEVQRNFALGSEWIYYKLYCGNKTGDEILTNIVKPCVNNWLENEVIDKWFFIRYGDPDPHLRVRFRVTSPETIGIVVNQFGNAVASYLENGVIWKIQTDTYQRELERYGAHTMEIAETIFCHDSQNCVDVLAMIESDNEGEKVRWLYALRAIDEYFNNFGFPLKDKLDLVERLRTGFGQEYGMNKYLNKQLDKKFRKDKQEIEKILNHEMDQKNELLPLIKLSISTSDKIKPLVAQIHQANENGKLNVPIPNLLSSYTHMFLNRFFKDKQRLHELVVYDYLWRVYRSQFARQKHEQKIPSKAKMKNV